MPKIIGRIVGVQAERQGTSINGRSWQSCQYAIEDATHAGEGIVARTFSSRIMSAVGTMTNGELTVEATYVPRLRHWDGRKQDGSQQAAVYFQENDILEMQILRGKPAAAHQSGTTSEPAQPGTAPAESNQQPEQGGDDLPF